MMKEREISLLDFTVEILLHWRGFLAWMLVSAIAFGTFSYVRSYNAARSQEANVSEAKQQLEQNANADDNTALAEQLMEGMTNEQIHRVNYAAIYEKLYAEKLDYLKRSLLMRIDPNHVQRGTLTFYISSDDWQRSHDIKDAYENLVQSGEAIKYVEGQIDNVDIGIEEGISLGRRETVISEYNRNMTGRLIQGNDTNIIRVEVVHYDEDICQNICQAITEFVEDSYKDMEKLFGTHEIAIVDQSFATVTDIDIANHQTSFLANLDTMEKTMKDVVRKEADEFSEIERRYYDFLTTGKATGQNEAIIQQGVTITPGISAKYVLLGVVLAAFVYAFILFMAYVLNTRIRSTDQLSDLYELPQLGMIPGQRNSKKFLGFVDRWILSLRNRNRRTFTQEEALELASVAVKMAACKEDLPSVCLVGCDIKGRTLGACEAIRDRLGKEGIQVDILNNVLYDAQAMGELDKAMGVVLVEQAGSTLYAEIAQELELLGRQEIKVLGGIVVGDM